ncbi:MAG: hypothetical protein EBV03_04560, partial [Proteobacteria bacterium]|nr:hypothetical protein [Pseudomonadota bacterium]
QAVAPQPLEPRWADDAVSIAAELDEVSTSSCDVVVTITIKDGWHINAHEPLQPHLLPTQLDVRGLGVQLLAVHYPEPTRRHEAGQDMLVYEGQLRVLARVKWPAESPQRPALRVLARLQPCNGASCHMVRDIVLSL